jgi:hypothetical protein
MNILKQNFNLNPDKFYLKCVIVFFLIWLFTIRPLRLIIKDTSFNSSWFVGVAPNFFAGITFVFWQTYGTRSKPFISFLYGVLVLMLSEFIQLFLPKYHADWNDILASTIGASLAALFVFFRSKRLKGIKAQ